MAVKALPQLAYNYVNGETSKVTRISLFEYKRPKPGSKTVSVPLGMITLPLPDNMPSDTYSMEIGQTSLGIAGNAVDADLEKNNISSLQKTIAQRIGANPDSIMGSIATIAAETLAVAPGIADLSQLAGLGISETAQAQAGIVRNPHTALLFNGVNLRSFNFNWRLSPRNEAQSRSLDSIIKLLKAAMHPDLEAFGFALNYPNLVKINFNNDKQGILDVDYAFIKDLSINPTPNGHAYYRNGYPSVVDLSMSVHEIRIKTTEDFGNFSTSTMMGRR